MTAVDVVKHEDLQDLPTKKPVECARILLIMKLTKLVQSSINLLVNIASQP